eukprot:gene33863-1309_t
MGQLFAMTRLSVFVPDGTYATPHLPPHVCQQYPGPEEGGDQK